MRNRHSRIFLWGGVLEAGLGEIGAAAALAVGIDLGRRIDVSVAGLGAGLAVGLAAAVPMLLLFFGALRSRWAPLVRIRHVLEESILPHFRHLTWWQLLILAVLAGIGEELLFRGFLQPFLAGRFGTAAAVVGASLVFGLLHWITPSYAVFASILGVYLGLLVVLSGNLVGAAVCHAVYDYVALSVYLRRSPTPPH